MEETISTGRITFFTSLIFVFSAIASADEQIATAILPKYNEIEMEKRCDEFLQSLDPLKFSKDYPSAIQNLLSVNPKKQIIGLKTLSETENPNAIPWIIPFLDSDKINVQVEAGLGLEKLVSSYTLKRRDMNISDKVVIKPLGKDDLDLRPLAWVILKMFRNSGNPSMQCYAASMAGYLHLTYFDEELQLLLKNENPAVVQIAQYALDIMKNAKYDSQEEKSPDVDEDYKVYSAAIVQLNRNAKDKDTFVIRQMTKSGKRDDQDKGERRKAFLKKEFGGQLSDELIENFIEVNLTEQMLQDKFDKNLHVIFISEAEEEAIFRPADGQGWQRFYSKYPRAIGIIEISRVAFNKEKTKALLYYGNSFDYKGGIGYYILLKKQGNEWVIQNRIMCWIV